ncbi:endonuclease/exonuclease/phosphatase family protein [Entomospira culicis]|uniref:Endonuclease/exonuclease/phosphatase domain-containing protein n=1 Tax=Entomospira culicis TaxID=2719989 RepID=A0A968GJH7_9SPIO|nr:endonuclease/exonuclease/phosphatase family protein [Entomospira culicis]NIZ19865.1 hypothetical protein [Entomospira culicis]NIZ70079.1 hypothetical protein [Entomospira culicis]WDI37183.1 endonuclease/exonuclease/phosphatase family protein [Entomospira culicis]WDI38812.1 endonuclease/exonuclease/phosphatase family protein [Entomospira culicis]
MMRKLRMRWIWLLWVGLLLGCLPQKKVVVISYNVQNLFDDQYQGTEYREFSEVSTALYQQKVSNLAGGFAQIAQSYGSPSILLLQEVENHAVVQALSEQSKGLQGMHILFAKEPSHATGLAILSRYEVIEMRSIQVRDPLDERQQLRPILLGVLRLSNNQPLVVINLHLQSQREERNVVRRSATFAQLHLSIERIRREYGEDVAILVGGDFNMDLRNASAMEANIMAIASSLAMVEAEGFYNPWPSYVEAHQEKESILGTYAYGGNWQALDGFLLARRLLIGDGLTFIEQRPITHARFLSEQVDEESQEIFLYPNAFYANRIDGLSDHLPIMAIFTYKNSKK